MESNMNQETLDKAFDQYYWIERYFDKQWMDSDYPSEEINQVLFYAKEMFDKFKEQQ